MREDRDALDRLRRANPVPPAARPELAARLDALRASGELDWSRVTPSERRHRLDSTRWRLAVVALVAVLTAVLLAASALGLHVPVVAFWQAGRASPRVELRF
ncbi:MAG: hypothetical protein C4306_12355 [Thermoleophilia bacterium]